MKPEDVYDGVTNIRDDLIEKAKKPKKGRFWPAAVAAVLVIALASGGLAALKGRGASPDVSDRSDSGGSEDARITTLAQAVYPDRPVYPSMDEDGMNVDEEEYLAWWEDARSRWLTQEETDAVSAWTGTLVPTLLTGAGDDNAVCSPVSVYLALGMLAEVTEGETRGQVLDALGAEDADSLRETAKRVWNAVYNADGSYTMELASSVWLRDDTSYETAPLQSLAENYYASVYSGRMGSGEYNAALQKWLNDNTGGLLEEAVSGVEPDETTALVLATTVLFKDKWASRFNPDKTDTGVFHAPGGDVEREFMHKTLESSYYWGERFAAVSLGFESAGEMRFLLPDEGVSAEEILSDPAAVGWLTDTDGQDTVDSKFLEVNLSIPKFDVTQDGGIGEKVKSLGVTDAFDPEKADFSPIMGGDGFGVWLSDVLHGARVMIDEEGCVGAAYTVMPANGAAAPPDETVDMVFDRPFIFTVLSDGLPVFAGVVNEP